MFLAGDAWADAEAAANALGALMERMGATAEALPYRAAEAWSMAAAGRPDEARAVLDALDATSASPGGRAMVHRAEAAWLESTGEPAAADAALRDVLTLLRATDDPPRWLREDDVLADLARLAVRRGDAAAAAAREAERRELLGVPEPGTEKN